MDDRNLSDEPQPNEMRTTVPPPPPVDPRVAMPPEQTPEEEKRKRSGDFALGCVGMFVANLFLYMIASAIISTMNATNNAAVIAAALLLLLNVALIVYNIAVLKRPYVAYGIIALLAAPLLLFGLCMAISLSP